MREGNKDMDNHATGRTASGERRPYTDVLARLRAAGLRPTRQRLALSRVLFAEGDRHITAEQLHAEALAQDCRVSLATVYNTLHLFTEAGLLRELTVETGRSYFDTNTADHHHFFFTESGRVTDIPADQLQVHGIPETTAGLPVQGVDVIVRVKG